MNFFHGFLRKTIYEYFRIFLGGFLEFSTKSFNNIFLKKIGVFFITFKFSKHPFYPRKKYINTCKCPQCHNSFMISIPLGHHLESKPMEDGMQKSRIEAIGYRFLVIWLDSWWYVGGMSLILLRNLVKNQRYFWWSMPDSPKSCWWYPPIVAVNVGGLVERLNPSTFAVVFTLAMLTYDWGW